MTQKKNLLPFYDVFAGTGVVSASVDANKIFANDSDICVAAFLYAMSHDFRMVRKCLVDLHNGFMKYDYDKDTGEAIEGSGHWIPMGKSTSNLYRYAEVSKATNIRYINALPLPIDTITPVKEIEEISKTIEVNNRNITGFNILNAETTKILETIASGDYIVNGITNKNLRCRIFKDEDINSTKIRNRTTRLLNKLKLHGIIKKVNHSSKYYLTAKGRKITNSILLFKNIDLPNNYA